MKEPITIRITKTMHQDPPHYSTHDSKLIRHTIAGLLGLVSDDLYVINGINKQTHT
jgi:hypothetical protein